MATAPMVRFSTKPPLQRTRQKPPISPLYGNVNHNPRPTAAAIVSQPQQERSPYERSAGGIYFEATPKGTISRVRSTSCPHPWTPSMPGSSVTPTSSGSTLSFSSPVCPNWADEMDKNDDKKKKVRSAYANAPDPLDPNLQPTVPIYPVSNNPNPNPNPTSSSSSSTITTTYTSTNTSYTNYPGGQRSQDGYGQTGGGYDSSQMGSAYMMSPPQQQRHDPHAHPQQQYPSYQSHPAFAAEPPAASQYATSSSSSSAPSSSSYTPQSLDQLARMYPQQVSTSSTFPPAPHMVGTSEDGFGGGGNAQFSAGRPAPTAAPGVSSSSRPVKPYMPPSGGRRPGNSPPRAGAVSPPRNFPTGFLPSGAAMFPPPDPMMAAAAAPPPPVPTAVPPVPPHVHPPHHHHVHVPPTGTHLTPALSPGLHPYAAGPYGAAPLPPPPMALGYPADVPPAPYYAHPELDPYGATASAATVPMVAYPGPHAPAGAVPVPVPPPPSTPPIVPLGHGVEVPVMGAGGPPQPPAPAPARREFTVPPPGQQFMPEKEKELTDLIVGYMESPTVNPYKGSVPVERIQNIARSRHSDLYTIVVGSKHNGWRHFVERHSDVFLLFTVDDGKWKMRLHTHADWQRGDEQEQAERARTERHFIACLESFLKSRPEPHKCQVDEFMEHYPTLPQNKEFRPQPYPSLPARGDLVRFIRKHPQNFIYNDSAWEIQLAPPADAAPAAPTADSAQAASDNKNQTGTSSFSEGEQKREGGTS